MKILFVASEATPLVKVGGLADVVGSLPKALRSMGHDVRIIIPQYGCTDTSRFRLTPVMRDFKFNHLGNAEFVNLNGTQVDGLQFYALEDYKYFNSEEIYTAHDLDRFYFFSRAVFEILPHLDWQPEIIHCHDWLTSLLVMWLKKAGYHYSSVFTIHNLTYQGLFDEYYMDRHDLRKDWSYVPPHAPSPPLSFIAQAILWADLVTTVSETYSREITTPEYGMGLDALLRYRQDSLTGIVNGLDCDYWDPQKDEYLPVNFNSTSMRKRALNKVALQKLAGLPENGDIPLIGMVLRLDEQKGLDILGPAIEPVLGETGSQLVVLGKGRENYETLLRQFVDRFPQQFAAFIAFEEPLAHLIYAGSDMFLMPSRFEPCGLGQLIAMHYGAVPVVRHTGGLVDTVPAFNSDLTIGNGFVFHNYTAEALFFALKEAASAFKNKDQWYKATVRVSTLDFSWASPAREYEKLYKRILL